MADIMEFPPTFKEFIKQYEYLAESDEFVINSKKVLDAWKYYTQSFKKIQKEITSIVNIINITEDSIFDLSTYIDMIQNNIYNIEDEIDEI